MAEFQAMVSREKMNDLLGEELLANVRTVTMPEFKYEPNQNIPLCVAAVDEDELLEIARQTQATPCKEQGLAPLGYPVLHLDCTSVAQNLSDIMVMTIYGRK